MRKWITWLPAALLCSACAAASAGHLERPNPPGLENEPRASWVIQSGPAGRESVVCRSDSEMPCILHASTETRAQSVVVSVYLYPADAKTSYHGAFLAGFVGGKGHETKIDYDSVPGRLPTATTTFGLVTKAPGEYQFRMALFAEVAGHTDPHQFQQTVPVRVVMPSA